MYVYIYIYLYIYTHIHYEDGCAVLTSMSWLCTSSAGIINTLSINTHKLVCVCIYIYIYSLMA